MPSLKSPSEMSSEQIWEEAARLKVRLQQVQKELAKRVAELGSIDRPAKERSGRDSILVRTLRAVASNPDAAAADLARQVYDTDDAAAIRRVRVQLSYLHGAKYGVK